MSLLLLQCCLRDEHGEVAVLHSKLPDFPVKEFFDTLPDRIGPWPQHVTTANIVILNHLGLGNHLEIQQNLVKHEDVENIFSA